LPAESVLDYLTYNESLVPGHINKPPRAELMDIHFEFVGGPLDGRVYHGSLGEPSDADPSEAERYYLLTHHGAVGQQFKVASPYAVETLASELLQEETPHQFQRHFYTVSHRSGDDDEVWITAEYQPEKK
jgi:hypothetical protein